MKVRIVLAFVLMSIGVEISAAHHAFTAEYDAAKLTVFKGTVSKVEWTNPHAHFYVDVTEKRGPATQWNFELGPVLVLRRLGWKQNSLKIGDVVTVEGYLAKDGSHRANAKSVTLADGAKVFAGSSADGAK